MAGLENIRSINGANAIVKRGDQIIGYATGVNVNEIYGLQRIDVLGEIDSRDIEPIGRVVNVAITFIRMIPNADASQSNAKGGGSVQRGLTPRSDINSNAVNTQNVTSFFQQGFDLEIFDSADFETEAQSRYFIQGCRPSSQSFALTRGTLMGVNVTCEAIRIVETDIDEAGIPT